MPGEHRFWDLLSQALLAFGGVAIAVFSTGTFWLVLGLVAAIGGAAQFIAVWTGHYPPWWNWWNRLTR